MNSSNPIEPKEGCQISDKVLASVKKMQMQDLHKDFKLGFRVGLG